MEDHLSCPFCGEQIAAIARKCKHCAEFLDPSLRPETPGGMGRLVFAGLGAMLLASLCLSAAVVAGVALPNAYRLRKQANEDHAVSGLRAIADAQEKLREHGGPDGPSPTYGDLETLGRAQLLPPLLASGIQEGYVFEVSASVDEPDQLWMATASPLAPGKGGDRYFAINHTGAVYYRLGQPFPLDTQSCELPGDAMPLGGGYESWRDQR
jgi:hypothetical protein